MYFAPTILLCLFVASQAFYMGPYMRRGFGYPRMRYNPYSFYNRLTNQRRASQNQEPAIPANLPTKESEPASSVKTNSNPSQPVRNIQVATRAIQKPGNRLEQNRVRTIKQRGNKDEVRTKNQQVRTQNQQVRFQNAEVRSLNPRSRVHNSALVRKRPAVHIERANQPLQIVIQNSGNTNPKMIYISDMYDSSQNLQRSAEKSATMANKQDIRFEPPPQHLQHTSRMNGKFSNQLKAESPNQWNAQSSNQWNTPSSNPLNVQSSNHWNTQSSNPLNIQSPNRVNTQSSNPLNAQSSNQWNTQSSNQLNAQSSNPFNVQSSNQWNTQSSNPLNIQSPKRVNTQSSNPLNAQSSNQWNTQSSNQLNAQSSNPWNAQSSTKLNAQSTNPLISQSLIPFNAQSSIPFNAQSSNQLNVQYSNTKSLDNMIPQSSTSMNSQSLNHKIPQSTNHISVQSSNSMNSQPSNHKKPQTSSHMIPQPKSNKNAQSSDQQVLPIQIYAVPPFKRNDPRNEPYGSKSGTINGGYQDTRVNVGSDYSHKSQAGLPVMVGINRDFLIYNQNYRKEHQYHPYRNNQNAKSSPIFAHMVIIQEDHPVPKVSPEVDSSSSTSFLGRQSPESTRNQQLAAQQTQPGLNKRNSIGEINGQSQEQSYVNRNRQSQEPMVPMSSQTLVDFQGFSSKHIPSMNRDTSSVYAATNTDLTQQKQHNHQAASVQVPAKPALTQDWLVGANSNSFKQTSVRATSIPVQTAIVPVQTSSASVSSQIPLLEAQTASFQAQTASVPARTASVSAQTASTSTQTTSAQAQTASAPAQTASVPAQASFVPAQTASNSAVRASVQYKTNQRSVGPGSFQTTSAFAPLQQSSVSAHTASIPVQSGSLKVQVLSSGSGEGTSFERGSTVQRNTPALTAALQYQAAGGTVQSTSTVDSQSSTLPVQDTIANVVIGSTNQQPPPQVSASVSTSQTASTASVSSSAVKTSQPAAKTNSVVDPFTRMMRQHFISEMDLPSHMTQQMMNSGFFKSSPGSFSAEGMDPVLRMHIAEAMDLPHPPVSPKQVRSKPPVTKASTKTQEAVQKRVPAKKGGRAVTSSTSTKDVARAMEFPSSRAV